MTRTLPVLTALLCALALTAAASADHDRAQDRLRRAEAAVEAARCALEDAQAELAAARADCDRYDRPRRVTRFDDRYARGRRYDDQREAARRADALSAARRQLDVATQHALSQLSDDPRYRDLVDARSEARARLARARGTAPDHIIDRARNALSYVEQEIAAMQYEALARDPAVRDARRAIEAAEREARYARFR